MTVHITPYINNTGIATAVGCYLADDATSYTDYNTFIEARRGSSVIIPATATEVKPFSIKSIFNKKKFFGKSVDQGETTSLVTDNPSEIAVFHVWCQSADKSSTGNALMLNVTLDYTARFFEPKDVAAS